jgi:hypothetical protein
MFVLGLADVVGDVSAGEFVLELTGGLVSLAVALPNYTNISTFLIDGKMFWKTYNNT